MASAPMCAPTIRIEELLSINCDNLSISSVPYSPLVRSFAPTSKSAGSVTKIPFLLSTVSFDSSPVSLFFYPLRFPILKEKIDPPKKRFKHMKASIDLHYVIAFRIRTTTGIALLFRFWNFQPATTHFALDCKGLGLGWLRCVF